jgi:ABC-2 type transport system ATP-binding protein
MERIRKHATIFYSTHILDDVQRVSDTVAILNNGELIAQAPIEELLKGSGATIYSVAVEGEADEAHALIVAQPWVTSVEVVSKNGSTKWQVTVSDEDAAEAGLLRLLMSVEGVKVKEFGKKKQDLEEVFLSIVEADNHD